MSSVCDPQNPHGTPEADAPPPSRRGSDGELPPAHLLVVDDDPLIRKVIVDRFRSEGHTVREASNGREALERVRSDEPDLMILDLRMPELDGFGVLEGLSQMASRPDVLVITAHGSIESAIRAVQMGALDFIAKPFDGAHLSHVVKRALEERGLKRRLSSLKTELSQRHTLVPSRSRAMREVLSTAGRAAASDATVLLLGESGTGKEVIARYLHSLSPRAEGPFVAINCATLSAELLTSELFGHERGAFTGAVKTKLGKLEEATGGTLFLDEIGEIPADLQAKLLRVLQEREFERVGGTRTLRTNVRVIAATHRDLSQAIVAGTFRQDLYYRLCVVRLSIPPLRERKEDLPDLIEHFLLKHGEESGRTGLKLAEGVQGKLASYDWPGNVRELSNVLERGAVLSADATIGLTDLPEEIREAQSSLIPPSKSPDSKLSTDTSKGFHDQVAEAKRQIIENALERTDGHQTQAAQLLGLTQPYLARLMKNLGMSRRKK